MEQRIYFIYKYTFPNGKVYIGQTYKGSRRFGRVSSYKDMLVRRAMDKYPNFSKEILEYCSADIVDEREQFYIAFFNSMNKEFGYNLASGGSKNKVLAESVKRRISEKHKGKTISQEMREKISKPVIQIDPDTLNAIARYTSMSEASNETGIDFSTISSVCRRKSSTAGGFFWCFEDEYDDSYVPRDIKWRGHIYTDEERKKISERYSGANNPMYGTHRSKGDNPHAIPVLQFDLNASFIAKYDCVKTACLILGFDDGVYSGICKCAKGKAKSAANYIWRYEGSDIPVEPYVRETTKGFKHSEESKEKMRKCRMGKIGGPRAKAVLQYDLDGNFIKEYVSANNADDELGLGHGNVYSACIGKKKSVGGFMWRFKTDNYPIKIDPYKTNQSKPVQQLDLNGNLIRVWNSAKEAGDSLGIAASGITACCKGYDKYVTAGGFKWKYSK